ncbi:MAG: hypothetical protein PHY44_01685 [Lachnospiraceae bacterium]|nr:hypothetical protein [Lachnospiraceae bacterium]
MANEIQEFINEENGLNVRAIQNKDGSISMNAEDTAIGFGWTRDKGGKLYVRWETINTYIKDLGFFQVVGKDDYVPESLFYLLGMKASNEKARKFQMWLATEVIPSIRKHGAFIADSENVDENYVLNELRFSQKRTIKTFSNADVLEIKKLYSEFREYVDLEYKYKTDDRVARYKSVEKGLQQLLDNLAVNPDNVGDCYNVKQLEKKVLFDRTTLEKRISGGQKAAKTRRIGELEEELSDLKSEPDIYEEYEKAANM